MTAAGHVGPPARPRSGTVPVTLSACAPPRRDFATPRLRPRSLAQPDHCWKGNMRPLRNRCWRSSGRTISTGRAWHSPTDLGGLLFRILRLSLISRAIHRVAQQEGLVNSVTWSMFRPRAVTLAALVLLTAESTQAGTFSETGTLAEPEDPSSSPCNSRRRCDLGRPGRHLPGRARIGMAQSRPTLPIPRPTPEKHLQSRSTDPR